MTEAQFYQMLGRIEMSDECNDHFIWIINQMVRMLDECDHEDFFGTEGWRHYFGWD